jgi:dolichyl-phosphate-mannose--protein O-mannosyl transferase
MNTLNMLFDVPPVGGGVGIFAVVALIFVAIAAAFFAFVMLRKTVKMAIRMIVVAVILLIAIVGSISFLWFSSGDSSPRPRPPANRVK